MGPDCQTDEDPYRLYVQGTPWMTSTDWSINTRDIPSRDVQRGSDGQRDIPFVELEILPYFTYTISAEAKLDDTSFTIFPCISPESQKKHAHATGTWRKAEPKSWRRPFGRPAKMLPYIAATPKRSETTAAAPPTYNDATSSATESPHSAPTPVPYAFRDGLPSPASALTEIDVVTNGDAWQQGHLVFSIPTPRKPVLVRIWRPRQNTSSFAAASQIRAHNTSAWHKLALGETARWAFTASFNSRMHLDPKRIQQTQGYGGRSSVCEFVEANM